MRIVIEDFSAPSHGENRGSSPLGSANKINVFAKGRWAATTLETTRPRGSHHTLGIFRPPVCGTAVRCGQPCSVRAVWYCRELLTRFVGPQLGECLWLVFRPSTPPIR